MRRRRFWFGVCDGPCPELRRWIDFALHELPDKSQAVSGDARSVPVALGGSGLRKQSAVTQRADSARGDVLERVKERAVTGRHEGRVGTPEIDYLAPKRDLAEMLRLQGFPSQWLEHQPWTMSAKRKMIGNGVPLPMARALARAVRNSCGEPVKIK